MSGDASFNELFIPLIARGSARRLWPQMGFADEAAEYLLDQLAVDFSVFGRDLFHEKMAVAQCAWSDRQLIHFIRQHPRVLGIELGAGLSTRFCRLCRDLDWPKFRWLDVDVSDATSLRQDLFPSTENHLQLNLKEFAEDNLKRLAWKPGQALIVVINPLSPSALESIKPQLLKLLLEAGSIRLLVQSSRSPKQMMEQPILPWLTDNTRLISSYISKAGSWLDRCLALFGGQRADRNCIWLGRN